MSPRKSGWNTRLSRCRLPSLSGTGSCFYVPHFFLRGALCLLLALLAGCESFSWGSDSEGQLGDGVVGGSRVAPGTAAAGFEWKVLRAGWSHTCGVREDNTLWCWGINNLGQLGDGTEDIDRPLPVQVGSASDWITVSPGSLHTCGIRAGGQLWCWGAGGNGQLGDGLSTGSLVPVRVGTLSDWHEVSAGGFRFTCGIRGEGDLYCWGDNGHGQLGVGDFNDRATPTPLGASPWKGVNTGNRHACAISAVTDRAFCWGRNDEKQIVEGTSTTSFTTPVEIDEPTGATYTVKQVAAGNEASCFLLATRSGSDPNAVENYVLCRGDPSQVGAISNADFPYVGCDDSQSCPNLPRFQIYIAQSQPLMWHPGKLRRGTLLGGRSRRAAWRRAGRGLACTG